MTCHAALYNLTITNWDLMIFILLQDADGKQSDFLGLVKKQAVAERQQYISQLREHLAGKG